MMQRSRRVHVFVEGIWLVGAVLALSSVAIANRFPLLFPDTGFFLIMSADFDIPWNRPIFYGLFLAPIHRLFGLWGIVFVQSALTIAMLHLFLREFVKRGALFTLLVALILTIGSSLPWFAGMIMPDLFQAFMVLCLCLLAFRWNEVGSGVRVFCLALFVLSTLMHYANFMLAVGMMAFLACWYWFDRARRIHPSAIVAMSCVTTVAVAFQVSVNMVGYGRPSLSEGTPAYVLSRLVETGLAEKFLDAHRDTQSFVLCDYRDQHGSFAGWYIYSQQSPFRTEWNEGLPLTELATGALRSEAESLAIIRGTLKEFPLETLWQMVLGTARQLVAFNTAEGVLGFVGKDWVEGPILRYFPESHSAFLGARQNHGQLPVVPARLIHLIVFALCIFAILLMLFRGAFTGNWLGNFLVISAMAYLLNAGISGVLAGPAQRYGSRLIWLFVLAAILAVWRSRGSIEQYLRIRATGNAGLQRPDRMNRPPA